MKFFINSFFEFFFFYGYFVGEEFEEDDEVFKFGEYFMLGSESNLFDDDIEDEYELMEDSVLLLLFWWKRRRKEWGGSGINSFMGVVLLFFKFFVGIGVLFLFCVYFNGGMFFSNLVLLFVVVLSYYCFVLFVNMRLRVEGLFGDIGGIFYGKWMRNFIFFLIVLS